MTLDPAVVIAAISALGALLILMFRLFLTGAIHPRNMVPREDYEAQVAITASYAAKFGEQTEVVKASSTTVEKLGATIEHLGVITAKQSVRLAALQRQRATR